MSLPVLGLLALLPATVLAATPSGNDEVDSSASVSLASSAVTQRRHGLFGSLGAFSAVGFAGISYGYAPSDRLAIEAGLGYGMSGVQLSLMPKWSFGQRHRLVLGLGPSLGLLPDGKSVSLWLNGDVGYELRAASGFSIAIVLGYTQGLAGCLGGQCRPGGAAWGDESDTQAWNSERAADYASPQGRIVIGKWF
jgi:hypothetical protein